MATDETTAGGAELARSLVIDRVSVSLRYPYHVIIVFTARNQVYTSREMPDDSMRGAGINEGDLVLVDNERTEPGDGDIVHIRIGNAFNLRTLRETPGGLEFHPAAPGYPILIGPRRIYGTAVALARYWG